MKNTFCYEAVRTRLELVTPCVTGMYSNQTELPDRLHHDFKDLFFSQMRVQKYDFFFNQQRKKWTLSKSLQLYTSLSKDYMEKFLQLDSYYCCAKLHFRSAFFQNLPYVFLTIFIGMGRAFF